MFHSKSLRFLASFSKFFKNRNDVNHAAWLNSVKTDQEENFMATVQQIPVLAARLVEHQGKFMPMSAKDAQYVIQNPADAIELFIESVQNRPECTTDRFPIWKTIEVGSLRGVRAIRKVLGYANCKVSDLADDILNKPAFKVATEKREIDLVVASVSEIGFVNGAHWIDVCKRAFKYDMDICPAEVGPQLRIQYNDQPIGERLRIVMQPIEGTESFGRVDPFAFWVEHKKDEGPCLAAYTTSGFRSEYWDPDQKCVFQRRRK